MTVSFKFFEGYDLQRICLDRVVITIYDTRYSMGNHRFDEELVLHYPQYVKRARIGKRSEDVIENANTFSSWAQRLRGPRTMILRYNVIRAYRHHHSIKIKNSDIIHEDNFYPVDFSPSLEDQLALLYDAIEKAKILYKDQVKEFWGYDCEHVEASIKSIEVPFEIYPANTSDIFDQCILGGMNLYRYTSESGTIYFQEKDQSFEDVINESYYQAFNEQPSMVSNKFSSGLNNKIQLKIYQKSWGIVRIEHTLYGEDIKALFHMDVNTAGEDAEYIEMFLASQFRERGLTFGRDEMTNSRAIANFARAAFLPIETIEYLMKTEWWQSSKDNEGMTRKLKNRGLLTKDNGAMRGYYKVDTGFKKMINAFPERDDDLPNLVQ